MSTGIDWNGNGKYDPVDVGIDIAREDEYEDYQDNEPITNSEKKIEQNEEDIQSDSLGIMGIICLLLVVIWLFWV